VSSHIRELLSAFGEVKSLRMIGTAKDGSEPVYGTSASAAVIANTAIPPAVMCEVDGLRLTLTISSSSYASAVLRRPDGIYKTGRSTSEEGLMMKLKPYEDAEAEIVGFEPERQDFFTPDRLGAFSVRLLSDPTIRFHVGTGLSDRQRGEFWNRRESMRGKILRFSYQSRGMKSAPRFPVFQGIRDESDI
jgi:ATP-dependent DNA ligase